MHHTSLPCITLTHHSHHSLHDAGIDELLQTVLWVAEEKALMSNPNKRAAGTVIEAHLDKKRGPVATLLVQVCTRAWACAASRLHAPLLAAPLAVAVLSVFQMLLA